MAEPAWPRGFAAASAMAALIPLAAACASGGSSHTKVTSAATTTPTTSPRAAPDTSAKTATTANGSGGASTSPSATADRAKAQSLVLTDADMPNWTSTAHTADPTAAASSATLAACIGIPDSYPHHDADANSADYTMGSNSVDNEVIVFTDNKYVTSDLAEFSSPKAKDCLDKSVRDAVTASLNPGDTIQAVTVTITLGAAPGRSRQVATVSAVVTVNISGQTQTEYNTQIELAGPRIEENVGFTSSAPLTPGQIDAISTMLATRLAAAT
jgi:hypothetical protein